MDQKVKTTKQMERHFKGAANHWRLDILLALGEQGGMPVEDLSESLSGNFATIAQHLSYLVKSGLVNKRHKGRQVINELSPYGIIFARFARDFRKTKI